jgi:Protein of unknown function (DUF3073)
MGRGRAKAKQTKVARQLKYSSGGTDLDRLQEELAAERGSSYSTSTPTPSADDEESDEYDPERDSE